MIPLNPPHEATVTVTLPADEVDSINTAPTAACATEHAESRVRARI
jgi:hypothetical protein